MVATWLLVSGGCATLEHPRGRQPCDGRFTIWHSALMQRLVRSDVPPDATAFFLETLRGGFCLGVYQVAEVFIAKTRGTEAPISQYGSLVSENFAPWVKTGAPRS